MMHYDAHKKSVLTAYILWFFLGWLGVHRLYLGKKGSGLLILACSIIATVMAFLVLPLLLWIVTGIYLVWDMFTISGQVERYNSKLIASLS